MCTALQGALSSPASLHCYAIQAEASSTAHRSLQSGNHIWLGQYNHSALLSRQPDLPARCRTEYQIPECVFVHRMGGCRCTWCTTRCCCDGHIGTGASHPQNASCSQQQCETATSCCAACSRIAVLDTIPRAAAAVVPRQSSLSAQPHPATVLLHTVS